MTAHHEAVAASVATSVITGLAVSIPEEALHYGLKIISVLVLAMVAEGGRQLVAALIGRGKKKP